VSGGRRLCSRPDDPLKVLHFSALDGNTGAGIAAARIHQALLACGVNSRFCVAHPAAALAGSFTPPISLVGRAVRRVRHALDRRVLASAARDCDYVLSTGASGIDMADVVRREQPDIVQLHWIGGNAFKLRSLTGLKVPVVWRMSDQWPFCGVQHLEPDPGAYSSPPKRVSASSNISEHVRYAKWGTYQTLERLVLVCPSRWLAQETRRSALLGQRQVEVIPTSCDTNLFSIKDRAACRSALGLPADKPLVLIGATSLGTRWKGLDLFVEAIKETNGMALGPGRKLAVVSFGQDVGALAQLRDDVERIHLGPVKDRRLMAILYGAADVFAAPSRMENLANTVLESLACGTPVVAFAIGGMPDMIDHQSNGYLAAPFDTDAFASGLVWSLSQRDSEALRVTCRQKVFDRFSIDQEIDLYLALYKRILGQRTQATEFAPARALPEQPLAI
jgi:glycosyltransferase involved in cell wall biosynthesis